MKTKMLAVALVFVMLFGVYGHSLASQQEILKSYLQAGFSALQEGKYAEAERLFRAALSETAKASLNQDTKVSATLVGLNGLSMALMNQEKYAEAEAVTRKQIEVLEATRTPDYPDYATALNNLGLILSHQRKFSEASDVHRRALSLREKYLGDSHSDVAISLLNLGKVYFDQHKHSEAEALLSRAVSIIGRIPTEAQTDENMLALAACDMNLSLIKVGQKKYEDAEQYLLIALMIKTKLQGATHPDLIEPLRNYVTLLRLMNRSADASKIEARVKLITANNQ